MRLHLFQHPHVARVVLAVVLANLFLAVTDVQGQESSTGIRGAVREPASPGQQPSEQTGSRSAAEARQETSGQTGARAGAGTGSANAGAEISEAQLVGLPLNGRSYSQLATLQSAITDPLGAGGSRGGGSGSLTASGGRTSSNTFLMDGTNIMDTNNQVPRSAAGVQLGSDALLQVQVYGVQYSAEYGRGSGGVLNSISRSGTDQFHGAFFEFFRNSALDARWFFDRPAKPPFKRNQFGLLLHGPIVKGRTYFMGGWEAMRDRLTSTVRDNVPDALARQGIITNERGEETHRVNVDARVRPYLALYPPVNDGILGGGFGRNATPLFLPTNENFFTVRVDHKISERDGFFVRYSFDDASSYASSSVSSRNFSNSRQQYLTLVGTHIFSPRLLTTSRFGFTRPVSAQEAVPVIQIPRSLFFVPDAPQFGQISLPGAGFGLAPNLPAADIMNSFQFAGDLLVQKGFHFLKFGIEIHRYRWDVFSSANKSASWSFNSLESFLELKPEDRTTGLSVALSGSDRKAFRQTLTGLYVQDEYRVRPRLHFSYGLRYEFATRIHDRENRTGALPDPLRDSQVQIGPYVKSNPSLLNFSPRIGLTWSPGASGDTVLSAGFGIYYDQLLEYVVDSRRTSAPFYRVVSVPNLSAALFPDAVLGATTALASSGSRGSPLQAQILDYSNLSSPMVLRYNFSLRRPFLGGWRGQASYVGARGNHLYRNYEINQFPAPIVLPDGSLCFPPDAARVQPQDLNPSCPPVSSERAGPINPAFGSINLLGSDAQSFYHSLQLSANRALGRGASVQASYTFAKSIDDTTSSGNTIQFGPSRTLDRALSDFDLRHRLVVSYFYNLPFGGQGRWWKDRFLGSLLGGWRLGGIVSTRNGTPINLRISVRKEGYLFAPNRPSIVPGRSNNPIEGETAGCDGVAAGRKVGTPDYYLDPCSFRVPSPGTLGNNGRNTVSGPKVFSMDLSLQREFPVNGKSRMQFRAELFNLTNHTNLRPFSANSAVVFSGASGRVNGAVGNFTNTVTTSRQMQFALRLSF